ncbi:MAG TPA: hypothetical protein VLW65_07030 [Bryobacteraceae bacterium]|nr:hypothetical protein [Bryobacteraceae bacterium]
MKPLDRLSEYLGAIERRLRLLVVSRGAAVIAAAALGLTLAAVLMANHYSFSKPSVLTARVLLFLGLASAIAAALVLPLLRLNRRKAARTAESKYPQFQERLLTFTERMEQNSGDPFLPLLAADTLPVAQQAQPQHVARTAWIFSFSSLAVTALLVLLWLGSGTGFLGYGTSLLWGGLPKGNVQPFYSIQVDPGNRTIRKRADQVVTAVLMGFTAPKVRFFARYTSSSQWEQAEMRSETGGSGFQFLIAGVPESLEYYVEAGGVRSQTYKLNVVDLPSVKNIRVTYHFPEWTGLKDAVEDPGGDLRAVQGTVAEVVIQTDRPLANGTLLLDDGSKISLRDNGGNALAARVPIQKDGMYHLAANEGGEDVRLSEDYFIEAQKDSPPEIAITRPGHDFKASPIEEVTVAVNAKDDFGLRDVELHYSVNGGPEKMVSLLPNKGAKSANGSTTISLEDFKVIPGDLVSVYASAKGARQTTNTDMFFIEAQPFERNYSQSQQDGGGGGGGGGGDDSDQQNQIAERQKEIITATWNQVKGNGARGTDAENANFLSSVQSKLRDQAKSMSDRMKARQIEEAGDAFKSFVDDMDKAVEQMAPAADKLKGQKWQDALAPEQKALQYLQRAFATFRDIQVAFGSRGGGGGGGGMSGATRDMQGLFDLELDTEKNQYESGRQTQSADARQRDVDDMLQKLEQLARRQQELADQARRGQQTAQQRWEQEMLRREAEQLQQQMRQFTQGGQLSRNGQQGQQQQGQQSQSGQSGQSAQSGQQGQMSQSQGQQGQPGQQGQQSQQQAKPQPGQNQTNDPRLRNADSQQLRQTLDRLEQALQDMRNAASSQQAGTPNGEAEARRAAERLQEAQQMLQGLRSAQSTNQVDELARQAEELAQRQQNFEGQMRSAYGQGKGVSREQAENLAQQKEAEAKDLKGLEQGMQNAVRDLMTTQRQASTKLREALGEMQQMEFQRDMQRNADYIRQGMGELVALQEAQITAGLNQLRDRLKGVQQALNQGKDGKSGQEDKAMAQALNNMEQLRRQMQQLASPQQGRNGQGQLNRNGQQQGGQQQGGQQAGGQQQGGQQQGGQQQAGGQQQGGGQQGGQQAGGGQQQGGGPQGGANGPRGGQWTNGPGGYHDGQYYGGNWNPNGAWDPRGYYMDGPVRPEQLQNTYRDALQSLNQLQQQMKDDPNTARDIQNLMRDLRQFDPAHYTNDPLLNERIRSALAGVEQVEMELRRKVDDATGGGSIRSPGSEPVPQGYADAVADYFRKLSKSKQ